MLENIIFTTNIVAPVFLIILLGYFLKRIGVINENFVEITSKFVFNVSLPAFIFMKISTLDLTAALDIRQIIFIYAGTLLVYFIVWIIASLFIKDGRDLSVFVQGAYRSNYAIVGLAIIANLFGDEGLGKATLILAFLLPVYNVLAVIILTVPMRKIKKLKLSSTVQEIILNPLIISVIVALPFSYFKLELPSLLLTTGNFLADVALPLALIGIGGSLNIENIRRASTLAFSSSILKLIVVPVVLTFFAYLFGYRGMDLGIMFILFACPTAIVSFIMAEAMGANSKLAGNIVVISTIGSVITISAAIIFLKGAGLI
ncbi:MAG: AEC family transporter [Bacteroidetes bacterium]|nr:AEC family transporter [Bacteroidota bacterium]MCH7770487.1 AEC family transporter [Bacteroidota bacterium]